MPYSGKKPLISVGIPFYNSAGFLKDAVRSVFAQTSTDWELILVDDGSRDDSLAIARSICDPRVRVYSDGAHKGLINRLNQIAVLSQSDYIARMDSDDLMHPERLQKQLDYLLKNPAVDVVGAGMYSLDNQLSPCGFRGAESENITDIRRFAKNVFIHVSVAGKRAWFLQNPYDERFVRAEDQELWLRTYPSSVFANLAEPLMYVREADSATFEKYRQSAATMRTIMRRYGPKAIGLPRTLGLVMQSYAKVFMFAVASITGFQKCLVGIRSRKLREDEQALARFGIERIMRTPLPCNE